AEAVGAEQNILSVRSPAEHDVVRRMKRQPLGLAAFGRNDVNVRIAVILTGEGDPLPVGRKLRKKLVADVRGQAPRRAAFPRRNPQVAGIREHDAVFGNVGEPQKLRWSWRCSHCRFRRSLRVRRGEKYRRTQSQPQHDIPTMGHALHLIAPEDSFWFRTPGLLNGRVSYEMVSLKRRTPSYPGSFRGAENVLLRRNQSPQAYAIAFLQPWYLL